MKRLTIDQTWEQCLAMWKWISRRCKGKYWYWCENNVSALKIHWLKQHGIKDGEINQNCFFCHKSGAINYCCPECPGKKVDPIFSCMCGEYDFEESPRKFYAELKRLNKIRLAKKETSK